MGVNTDTSAYWTPERITRLELALLRRIATHGDGLTLALWEAFRHGASSYEALAATCALMERYIGASGDTALSTYWHALIDAAPMGQAA